jgi:hypothetical protein
VDFGILGNTGHYTFHFQLISPYDGAWARVALQESPGFVLWNCHNYDQRLQEDATGALATYVLVPFDEWRALEYYVRIGVMCSHA